MKHKKLGAVIGCVIIAIAVASGIIYHNQTTDEMQDMTSMELVEQMTIGWNLGNTLDVCAADRDGDGVINEYAEVVDETLWGNPKATKDLFVALQEDGINAVRIPVTWRDHVGAAPQYEIDKAWMERVQEVVDYAYDCGMYVIINLHHDGGDDAKFGAWVRDAATDYDAFVEKYDAIWEQIAKQFGGYSERLIFESMNEVGFDSLSTDAAYSLLNRINQHFVDIIRATGGNNKERHLLIAGYWTDVTQTCDSRFVMPEDPAGHCIVSVHYYTPWEFCITDKRDSWGTKNDVVQMRQLINKLNDTFVDAGIPVIIGEYGTGPDNDTASRIYFCENLAKICDECGIATFLWDNGEILDRTTYEWQTPGMLAALQRATSGNAYEVEKAE